MILSTIKNKDINGLVLTGGKSSRMGTSKADIIYHKLPQWQHCYEMLNFFCLETFLSTSSFWTTPSDAKNSYLEIKDTFTEFNGPLSGILSAFSFNHSLAWLVMACDMPFVSQEAISFLLSKRAKNKEATVFINKGEIEPLLAIYEPSSFKYLLSSWKRKELCPKSIIKNLDFEGVKLKDERWCINVNNFSDFELSKNKISGKKEIFVKYFALLKEERGLEHEKLLTKSKNILDFYLELKAKHGFSVPEGFLRVAVNDSFVEWDHELCYGDKVVFVPPVAGG